LRTAHHIAAAQIREARGEYSAALYHYVLGKASAQAVWLWFSHRSAEIGRGRGAAALTLLNEISLDDLPEQQDRAALLVARGELLKLAGRAEEAEAALAAVATVGQDAFFAYTQELQGDVLEMQGRVEEALQRYRASLHTWIGAPQLREVTLHHKLSYLYMVRLQNLQQAGREALLARLKAETFHGNVVELSGDFAAAQARYEAAQALAELLGDDPAAFSLVYSHRGKLELKLGRHEQAIVYMQKAIACDEQRGDRVGPLYDRINLAFTHILMGDYEEAYRQARQGLAVAEQMRHAHLIAGLAAAAGEACCHLNRLEEAEGYVSRALEQEEEHFIPWALTVLGVVRSAQQRVEEAVRVLEKASELARAISDQHGEAYALAALGDVYGRHRGAEAAQPAYQAALALYRELGMQRECSEISKKLAKHAGVLESCSRVGHATSVT
ncbi:MAG: tetratricopeptide repeat protein, partial [Candidatus Acidiferrales bacterium]